MTGYPNMADNVQLWYRKKNKSVAQSKGWYRLGLYPIHAYISRIKKKPCHIGTNNTYSFQLLVSAANWLWSGLQFRWGSSSPVVRLIPFFRCLNKKTPTIEMITAMQIRNERFFWKVEKPPLPVMSSNFSKKRSYIGNSWTKLDVLTK